MKELTDDERKEIARLDAEIAHLESEIGLRIALREVTRTGKGYPPANAAADIDDVDDARTAKKAVQIRSLVRRQLIVALQDDLDGGELLMKEVWEECPTDDLEASARREIEEILAWLRDREQRLGEED